MQYEIKAFNRNTGSALVRFWTDAFPAGLLYSIDIPVVDGAYISGADLADHIMRFAPYGQIDRLVAVAALDASGIEALVTPDPAPPPPSVDEAKRSALAAIDTAAGTARARYITVAPGQEATYILKAQQARDYRAAGYTGTVPALVQAEADATGETPAAACDRILAEEAAWVTKAAQIESARRRGKVAVGAALDVAAVEAARDAAITKLAGL